MERRYLVAALAIVATFTGFSHGFRALHGLSFDRSAQSERAAAAKCWVNSAAQTVARVRAHFHHGYSPEQAQMVAEMNLPDMESSIAEQMSRQDTAMAHCAREKALQQAERAREQAMRDADHVRRDAMRLRESYKYQYVSPMPPSPPIAVALPSDLEQQIQKEIAVSQVQMHMAAERMGNIEIPAIHVETDVAPMVVPDVKCKVKVSRQSLRDAMHGVQYGFTSK